MNPKKELPKINLLLLWTSLIMTGIICLFLLSVWVVAKVEGPPPINITKSTTIYYDDHKHRFAEASFNNQKSYWVSIKKIAPDLQNATIAIEDKHFYQNHGFDFRRMLVAALADLHSFSKVQGASTITMQYARNLYLSQDKTWTRKLMEAFYTIRLEMNYSKKQILEGYLNTIYYGAGNYGIEAASRYYFGKSAQDLNLAESSMLAGIPKGPTYYSPLTHYEKARKRQKLILKNMVNDHMITKSEAKAAYAAPLHFVKTHKMTQKVAPYFQDEVTYILTKKLGMTPKQVAIGGYKVYTTLDVKLQKEADKWVKKTIDPKSDIQAALVAMDPNTGDVKALVGGRNYKESTYDRAIQAKRTPGSSFKPFLYYQALRNGFTPSTRLRSEPTTFTYNHGHSTYSPHNFGGYYAYGPITLAQALALSDNIYAVKTNMALGPEKLVKSAKMMGITGHLSPLPSLALGSMPVSLLHMTEGYSTIANGGVRHQPVFITKIVDRNGKTIYQADTKGKKVLDSRYAFVLAHMMTGTFDDSLDGYSKVTGSTVKNILTHKVAGKSGSTTSDSWMLGFTPQLTAGVWIGYDSGKPISTYPDSGYSKDIWAHFMEDALQGQPKNAFVPPKGVVGAMVNPKTGLLASKDCPTSRWTYYIKGTEPTTFCHVKHAKKEETNPKPAPQKKKSLWDHIKSWF